MSTIIFLRGLCRFALISILVLLNLGVLPKVSSDNSSKFDSLFVVTILCDVIANAANYH